MKSVLIVIDGFGIGAAPDAANYGDEGCNTYRSAMAAGNGDLKNLKHMGLNNIDQVPYDGADNPTAAYGSLVELSAGKDTTTGHFEIAGLVSDRPFPTYPNGFPNDIIERFERDIGRGTLFNGVASGTEIINRLGDEHVKTGCPIVYTSADSVFQIAMHESVIPLAEQIEICRAARKILSGKHAVARVIMRPFTGENGRYTRTANRRDFSVPPYAPTMLDKLTDCGYTTFAIGKIEDIFAGRGITVSEHTADNAGGIDATVKAMRQPFDGLIFTNLVDTDMVYGHRRDASGYFNALKAIDERIPELIAAMSADDELIITGDHGCDPGFRGTDHTREYVPLLIYGGATENLGTVRGFDFIARRILDRFGVNK